MATKKMVRCIQCKHGKFMQWFRNPIICMCEIHEEKFVAASRRLCDDYEETKLEPQVEHFDQY